MVRRNRYATFSLPHTMPLAALKVLTGTEEEATAATAGTAEIRAGTEPGLAARAGVEAAAVAPATAGAGAAVGMPPATKTTAAPPTPAIGAENAQLVTGAGETPVPASEGAEGIQTETEVVVVVVVVVVAGRGEGGRVIAGVPAAIDARALAGSVGGPRVGALAATGAGA